MLLINAHKARRKVLSYMASFIFSGEGLTPAIKDTDNPSEFSRGYVEGAKSLERIVFQKDNLVEAEPVKHGRWIDGNPYCPICGKDKFRGIDADIWSDWKPDFCPSCGADMRGGNNER